MTARPRPFHPPRKAFRGPLATPAQVDQWFADARGMTEAEFPKFADRALHGCRHDYSSICEAAAALMYAALYVVDNSPQGGLTGFQAGWIMNKVRALVLHGPGRGKGGKP